MDLRCQRCAAAYVASVNSTPNDTRRYRQILHLTGQLVPLTVWLEEFALFASQSVVTNREKFAKRLGMRGFEAHGDSLDFARRVGPWPASLNRRPSVRKTRSARAKRQSRQSPDVLSLFQV